MNRFKTRKLLTIATLTTLLYLFILVFDIFPLIRGPFDSILQSQWPYYFVNTLAKAWIFIPIYCLYIFIIKKSEKNDKLTKKDEIILLISIIALVFVFQISLVYFSRFGISILFRRLVDPGINGYFSTAIGVDNLSDFLANFQNLINQRILDQHASGHPPGTIIFIKAYLNLISLIPNTFNPFSFVNQIQVDDAKNLWNTLSIQQKFASLSLPFLLHLITAFVVVPFYYLSKLTSKNSIVALKCTIIFSIIPSFSFFALIFDPLYLFFPLMSYIFAYTGVSKKNEKLIFLSGIVMGLGLLFTTTFLTLIIGLLVFALLSYIKDQRTNIIKYIFAYLLGLTVVILTMYLFQIDLISILAATIHNQANRNYLPWLFFNPFDFFQYMGITLSVLFIFTTFLQVKKTFKNEVIYKLILYSFWITFLLLIASGVSRGEVGRIWLPFMIFPTILTIQFATQHLKLTTNQFILIFTLIFVQAILMEEFWVPIW